MIQKPYSISINGQTIDCANEDNLIKWKVSGAVQKSFSIEIRNNSNGSVVFTVPQTISYLTQYNLAAGSLPNGNEYKITITVFDENNNSATSDQVIFQTSSRPIVTVNPVGNNGTVENASYNFTGVYSQSESVAMKSYIAYIYDSNQNVISKSDIKTTTPLEFLFNDLQSEKSYYIEFQATSNKGLTGTSGLVEFNVLYTSPYVNTTLSAKNVENAGIELNWRVVQILGATTGTTSFVGNSEIDVTDGSVYFDNGFSVSGDFSLKLWIRNPKNKEDLIILSGANGNIRLQYHLLDEKFHLYKSINNGFTVSWESGVVTGGNYYVYIQQIGSSCNIYAEAIV